MCRMYQLVICLGFSFVFFFPHFFISIFSMCLHIRWLYWWHDVCRLPQMCWTSCQWSLSLTRSARSMVWKSLPPRWCCCRNWRGSIYSSRACVVPWPHSNGWVAFYSVSWSGVDTDTCIPDPLAAWMKPKSKVWERLTCSDKCCSCCSLQRNTGREDYHTLTDWLWK